MTLTDLSSLQIVAGFSETDAVKLKVGQPATVSVAALPGQSLQGKVVSVDTTSTVVSNVVTYNATITILNGPAALKPGMTATVAVTTAEKDGVLILPASAITARGNTATVQVVQTNGKTVTKTITIGMRGDTVDEITSGLAAGDKVITTLGATAATTGSGAARTGTGGAGAAGGTGAAGAAGGLGGGTGGAGLGGATPRPGG
jgi:RND family efflux transporter MFP subunit